jgi:hypothetical protein
VIASDLIDILIETLELGWGMPTDENVQVSGIKPAGKYAQFASLVIWLARLHKQPLDAWILDDVDYNLIPNIKNVTARLQTLKDQYDFFRKVKPRKKPRRLNEVKPTDLFVNVEDGHQADARRLNGVILAAKAMDFEDFKHCWKNVCKGKSERITLHRISSLEKDGKLHQYREAAVDTLLSKTRSGIVI